MSSAFDIYCALDGGLDGQIICDERMSRHCTYRIGGPADLFIECASTGDLALTLHTLSDANMPWVIIGKGSNLLVSDNGVRGAVIVLGRDFKRSNIIEGRLLVAGAAVSLSSIVQDAFKRGYAGLEFAVGIPGSLGGAIHMNAGTRDEWIGKHVEAVTVFNMEHGLVRHLGVEIPWQYRRSNISADDIIVEAELSIAPGEVSRIRAKMEASLSRRKKSQPLSLPNAGSIFKNPEGMSVGKLIEEAGLKGTRIGGAQVSELHANFIVNVDDAKAQDVVDLMALIQQRVREVHGVELQPEVRFLGF